MKRILWTVILSALPHTAHAYIERMYSFREVLDESTNILTGKVERDMTGARQMIDLLAELETRTEGNRSADETRLLRGALTELRLNYLEEMKKPAEEAPSPETHRPSS